MFEGLCHALAFWVGSHTTQWASGLGCLGLGSWVNPPLIFPEKWSPAENDLVTWFLNILRKMCFLG